MAIQTIYPLATVGVTPNFWGNTQLNGTAPTAANSAFGWGPGKTAVTTPNYRARIGATAVSGDAAVASSTISGLTAPRPGTGTGATTASDSFVAGPFSGSFASGTWTFNWNLRASTAGAIGHLNMQVFRSTNANGTGAVAMGTFFQGPQVTLSTTADVNCLITFNPGVLNNLAGAYLFFQLEWVETTAGSSNSNNVLFRVGTSSIVTPDFVAAATGTVTQTQAAQTVSAAGNSIVDGDLIRLEVNDTFAGVGGPRVAGSLAYTELPDTLAATASADVGGTLALTEISDALAAHGTVTGGVAPWTPADLGSDLWLWLDGKDAATITITGSGVSAWANKGTSPCYTVQSLDPNRPTYANDTVSFIDPQVLAVGNAPSVYDFFVVGKPNDSYNWRTLLHNSDGHNLVLLQTGAYALGGYNEIPPYFRQAGTYTWPVVDGIAYGQIGSGEVMMSRDGGALVSTTIVQPVDKTTINFIGGYYSVANNGNQGFGGIKELILVPYLSTTDTRQKLEGYSAWKWGLQALLPVDHPYALAPPGGAALPPAITGTLAVTEDADTFTATGGVSVGGTLTQPQVAQTITAAGTVRVGGTLTLPQAAHTLAAAGSPRIGGTLTQPQAAHTLVAAGGPRVGGTLTQPQANHTLAAVGTVRVDGALNSPQAVQTLVAAGGPRVAGTLGAPQANHTIAAAGGLTVLGTLAVTEALDTLAAAGGPRVTATLTTTEPADTLTANGRVAIPGSGPIVLLCHADGTNGSTGFTDSSSYGHTLTATSVQVNTANPKFGTGDAYFTFGNANASIDAGSSPDFWFDAAPFTIEAWCYPNAMPGGDGYSPIFAEWGGVLANLSFFFNVFPAIQFFWSPDGTSYNYIDSGIVCPLNTWSHVAVDRDASGTVRIYLNGAVIGSGSVPSGLFHSTFACQIGNDNTAGRAFPGALDEIRVSKGVAQYGGAFTPPTAPFPDTAAIGGDLHLTQANQTVAATGTVAVRGTLAVTEVTDGLAAAGGPSDVATLTATQAAQALSATGGPRVGGTLTAGQAGQALAALGTVGVRGTLSVPQAAHGLVAAGTVRVSGTLAQPQAAHTLTAAGGPAVTATLARTQADQTVAAQARATVGAVLALIQASQIVTATGTMRVGGALGVTQDDQTVGAYGLAGTVQSRVMVLA